MSSVLNGEKINILDSTGMSLKQYWKKKVLESLTTIYGDRLSYDKINILLDSMLNNSKNPKIRLRNIYKNNVHWYENLDDILKIVDEKKLIIGANGTYNVRQHEKVSELTNLIDDWIERRGVAKDIELKAVAEKNNIVARAANCEQTNVKTNTNSSYGVSTMNGFILYSPDSASLITVQSREYISEMLWTAEKLLSSNMVFKNMNEFYAYVNAVCIVKLDEDLLRRYRIRIPNQKMIRHRMKELLNSIPREIIKYNMKSLYNLEKSILKDPIKSINFYYKYNLLEAISNNKMIMDIYTFILKQDSEFNSPTDKYIKKECPVFYEPIQELNKILIHLTIAEIPTYDRVEKNKYRKRRRVVISDTDSIIVNFRKFISFIRDNAGVPFDLFHDEHQVFKISNTMSYTLTKVLNIMGNAMASRSYVPVEYQSYLEMKNEFYFKSLILYCHVKKNYSAWVRIREGEIVDYLANTGKNLSGSDINPYVSEKMMDIITNDIHHKKDVSITDIMRKVFDLKTHLRDKLLIDRDVSFGNLINYKNIKNKMNFMSNCVLRGVAVWNTIYPAEAIEPYNKVYYFTTLLEKEDQLYLIKNINDRELIREKIFRNPPNQEFLKFGLRSVCLPNNMTTYPQWLGDILDINKIIETHTNPITVLMPTINGIKSRINSKRESVSTLLRL